MAPLIADMVHPLGNLGCRTRNRTHFPWSTWQPILSISHKLWIAFPSTIS